MPQQQNKRNRFKIMGKIRDNVKPELDRFKDFCSEPVTSSFLFDLLEKKFTNRSPPLRSSLVSIIYLYLEEEAKLNNVQLKQLGGNNKELFLKKLPFIAEVVMTILYHHNHILDRKNGVTIPYATNMSLLKGNLLKDYLYDYIEYDLRAYGANVVTLVMRYVRRIFRYVDIGQYIEKNHNTYTQYLNFEPYNLGRELRNFINPIVIEDIMRIITPSINGQIKAFTTLYIKRMYLTSGALFVQFTQLIYELTGNLEKFHTSIVKQYTNYLGVLLQIVNDICDCLPNDLNKATSSKNRFDGFSDLKGHIITLPIILELRENTQDCAILAFLQTKQTTLKAKQKSKIYKQIIKTRSIYDSINIGRAVKNRILELLEKEENQFVEDFRNMLSVANNNKFYRNFYFQKK